MKTIDELREDLASAHGGQNFGDVESCAMALQEALDQVMISELSAKLERVEADAVSYFVDIVGILEIICSLEHQTMHGLRTRKSIIGLLSKFGSPDRPKVGLSEMREGETSEEHAGPRVPTSPGGSGTQEQCEQPGKPEVIGQGAKKEKPESEHTRQAGEGPLQGSMPMGAEKCGCQRPNSEAEELSGLRVGGLSSRASQRLQQALSSGMALQLVSREEAQKISERLITGSGQRLIDELATLRATANHLASEGWVKLNWRMGTERPPNNGLMVCVSPKGQLWSCHDTYYVSEDCRWIYASELLSADKAKEGAE